MKKIIKKLIISIPYDILQNLIIFTAILFSPLCRTAWIMKFKGPIKLTYPRMLLFGYKRIASSINAKIINLKLIYNKIDDIHCTIEVKGEEKLSKALVQGRGVILVGLHMIDDLILHLWINRNSIDWQPYLIKRVTQEDGQTKIYENRIIKPNFARDAIKILQAKGTVILAQDNITEDAEAIPFLGREIKFKIGSVRLAQATSALIIPVAVKAKFNEKKWQVSFENYIDPNEAHLKEKVIESLERFATIHPEFWFGWHILWQSPYISVKE